MTSTPGTRSAGDVASTPASGSPRSAGSAGSPGGAGPARAPGGPTAPPTGSRAAASRPPLPGAARDLLAAAARSLLEASLTPVPAQRYVAAHLAALRTAAAVLAARARPASGRSRVRSVWTLLSGVAPDLAEWAAYFAAGAGKRAAAEAGLAAAVSPREADDLVRAAETFLALVAGGLGVGHQVPLPAAVRLRPAG